MLVTYLVERKSWIMFFMGSQLLLLFVGYVDASISVSSLLYPVFLLSLLFVVFLLLRWRAETRFYRKLDQGEENVDVMELPEGRSPFELVVEKRLIQQVDKLQEITSDSKTTLEQEKDDLLSWIHEVKTPMTAMRLMIDRLQDNELKSGLYYEWLRIHLLLDQQLHQKRIPHMENDLYIEETSLKSIIFKEIKTLQSWCIQKGIGIDVDLDADSVLSDAKWLAFIIRQLLTNAVKYSEGSDIEITSYEKSNQVHLVIKDKGRGIDSKDLPRIFDKGFTSTWKHEDNTATGMGLYLAKKSAQSLLIKIEVVSKLEEGTTCTLLFPGKNEIVKLRSV